MNSSTSSLGSSSSSSDGSLRPISRPTAVRRLRPLAFHAPSWVVRSLRPAGDFVCVVLFPSIFGVLGSYREGSRLLLFLELRGIAHLLPGSRDIHGCLLAHLALEH